MLTARVALALVHILHIQLDVFLCCVCPKASSPPLLTSFVPPQKFKGALAQTAPPCAEIKVLDV